MRVVFAMLLALAALTAVGWPAAAEQRLALVIGNAAYRPAVGALRNPANDARLMAATLRQLNFETTLLLDADHQAMNAAIVAFGAQLEAAGTDTVGLFYYAGHGVAAHGENYLLPLDARIESERELTINAVPASLVLTQMQFAGNRLNFLVLDACRNNPMSRTTRSGTRGLARMDAPRGTLIVYATQPGNVAEDGVGDNSPFTLALSDALKVPGIDAQIAVRRARVAVMQATAQRQVPWEEGGLTQEFHFAPGTEVARPQAPPGGHNPADPATAAWHALGPAPSIDDLNAFVLAFPGSPLRPVALEKLQRLEAQSAEPPPAPRPPQVPPAGPPPVPPPAAPPPPVIASLPPEAPPAAPVLFPEDGQWSASRGTVKVTMTLSKGEAAVSVVVGNALLRGTTRFADPAQPRRVRVSLIGRGTNPSVQLSGEFPTVNVTCLAFLNGCPATTLTLVRKP